MRMEKKAPTHGRSSGIWTVAHNGNPSGWRVSPYGGTLRLIVNCVDVQLPDGFPDHQNDNRILRVCLGLREKAALVILVTKDIVVRVKT